MENFPVELLFLIVSFQGRRDRINFALASKKLMSVICSIPGFERKVIYIDEYSIISPLLLVSNYFKRSTGKKSKIGIYCHSAMEKKIKDILNTNVVLNSKFDLLTYNNDLQELIFRLSQYQQIISNNLMIIIICHSFRVPLVPINGTNMIPIDDYFQSIKLNLNPINILDLLKNDTDTLFKRILTYQQPSEQVIDNMKKTIIKHLPFKYYVKMIE